MHTWIKALYFFTRFSNTPENDINVAKVIFIIFQPIWLLERTPFLSLSNNCSFFSRVVCIKGWKPYLRREEIFTILIIVKLKKAKFYRWKETRRFLLLEIQFHLSPFVSIQSKRKQKQKQASDFSTNENFINASNRVCNNINIIIGTVCFSFFFLSFERSNRDYCCFIHSMTYFISR